MKDIIKLSWKNLMLNKNRTITTLVMIIITVATFAGISIMYESAIKGLEQTFKETKGDYHIAVKNVDKDYNKDLLKADNVKEVNEYYTISKGVSRKGIEKDITKEKGKEYLEKLSDEEREAEIQKVMSKLKKSKWYIQKYELNKNEGDYTKQQEETKKNEQIILNPYLGLDILGVNKEDLKGYNFRLIDGRFPENENEIMLQKSSKTSKYIFNLGTTLTMNGKEYKVVGYVNNVFDSNESKLDIGILKIASTEEKKEALNKIQSIYIKDIGKRVKATAEGISQTLKEDPKNKDISMAVNKNLLRLQNANLQGYESSTDNVLSTLEMMRNVLIGIVAISGIIIMYNSFNLSLVERRKQYGILKSLGIKNSSLYIMILFEALVLSVVGIVIGYLCGMLGDYLVIGYINNTLVNVIKSMGVEKDLQIFLIYTTNIHAFYIVAISTTITVLLAAMIPAIKSTRISPIENIRGKDDYVVNTKKVKTSNISKKILGVEFDLARKNMKRAKKRFRVATLSLSIAFILLFVIGTLGTQINNQIGLLEVQTNAIFKNGNIVEMDHINITDKKDPKDKKYTEQNFQDMVKFATEEYKKELEKKDSLKVNRVILADTMRTLKQIDTKNDLIKTLSDSYLNNTFKRTDDKARQEAKEKIAIQVVNNKNYNKQDKYNLNNIKDNEMYLSNVSIVEENGTLVEKPIFDESKIIGKEIEINGKKIKIVKAPVNSELLLTASSGTTFLTGYVNEKTLSEVMRNDKDLFGFRIFYQSDLKGDKKIEDITKKQYQLNFEKKYDFAKLQMFTEGVLTPAGVIGMIKGMITIFQLLLYGFLILVILMSVVNIFTTITINILLRSRELAILKSVGMSDKQFDKMLRGENYIACLRSIIFGIVVSLILLFLTKFVIDKGKVNIDFKFIMDMLGSINYIALIISIIIVYVITFISTLFAKKSIRSQDIVEVIRRDNI
jgi:ABC transporter, ATP-binding protein